MSIQPVRVGLLSFVSPAKHWPESGLTAARQWLLAARDTISSLELTVEDVGELTRTPQQAAAHGAALAARGAQVLVLYVGCWSFATAVVAAAQASGLPAVLWTNARKDTGGLIGAAAARGALAEIGRCAPLLYGDFTDPQLREDLREILIGLSTARRLRGLTYGQGGANTLGMVTAAVDPNQWRQQFGIDTDYYDTTEVLELARGWPEPEVRDFLTWLKGYFGRVTVSDEVAEAQVRLFLALSSIIQERGFDFISVRCLPEMPSIYTTFCLAHALLNDGLSPKGLGPPLVCSCETDANAALTMQLLQLVSGDVTAMGDLRHLDPQTRILSVSNCGSQPTRLAPAPREVHWVPHGFQEFPWRIGGMAPQYVCRPGRVTLARLGRLNGRYAMMVTSGEALPAARDQLRETFWEFSPHAFIRLDCSPHAFLANLLSNHISLAYGDLARRLEWACQALDVEPIILEK